MTDRRPPTRADLLANLADDINQLCEPRRHTEYFIREIVHTKDGANGRRRKTTKRTRERRPHNVTLPSLLDALVQAMIPGTDPDSGGGGGGFESRPPAELEPVAVLREITTDVHQWARDLGVDRTTLVARLHGLVGATMTDEQLRQVARAADRWVMRARQATGFDPPPFTMGGVKCPLCGKANGLLVAGDLEHAKCQRCGSEWTSDTIGLFAEMLRANQTQETAVLIRCYWPECVRRGPHDVHNDTRGRTWRDTCQVPNNERTTA